MDPFKTSKIRFSAQENRNQLHSSLWENSGHLGLPDLFSWLLKTAMSNMVFISTTLQVHLWAPEKRQTPPFDWNQCFWSIINTDWSHTTDAQSDVYCWKDNLMTSSNGCKKKTVKSFAAPPDPTTSIPPPTPSPNHAESRLHHLKTRNLYYFKDH